MDTGLCADTPHVLRGRLPDPFTARVGISDTSATFECDRAGAIRHLVGALLGALAEAERRGVIAPVDPIESDEAYV